MGGEADLSGRDLRERSFRNRDLRGAALRAADLRGADFTGADLRGADLSATRLGMPRRWSIAIFLLALVLSLAIGVIAGLAGEWLATLVQGPLLRQRAVGVGLTVELAAFLSLAAWKGLDLAVRLLLPVAVALAVLVAVVGMALGLRPGSGALAVLAFSALLAAVIVLSALARVLAGTQGRIMFAVVAISGAVVSRLSGGGWYAIAIAIGGVVIAQRALAGKASPRIARMSDALACAGGTRFRGADLRGATFASASVHNTDFRGAALDGARFEAARIDRCLFDSGGTAPPAG